MNLKEYTGYFHDGGIIDIRQTENKIEISMDSRQLQPEWNKDNIPLSSERTIKGILHLENIKSIILDNEIHNTIEMVYDSSILLNFNISEMNKIELGVIWINFPPKERLRVFQSIKIIAEKIYWENIPDLFDPWNT